MKASRPKYKIRKNDVVIVRSGDDRGKKGRVLEVYPDQGKAIVEGINLISRHTKPNARQTQGGIIKKEAPVPISKLSLIDPKDGKPTRIGIRRENGKVLRVSKRSGEIIK
ncbi:MAG: 50S ribosomal protein L24 [Chitinophagales bacterium]|nr:50S ribosomal protein L24 [Chitinophagales bacterium]MDW8394300.1 50S ribosomal protein L24 [Chitinophagales bacterium]